MLINSALSAPTANNVTTTYDGTVKTATASSAGNTITYYDALSGGNLVTAPSATNAGTYIAYAQALSSCGASGRTPVTLTINKATATLSLSNLTYAYDGTAKTVTVTTSPAGLAGVSVVGDNQTNAGSYPVTASLTNPNYSATDATGTLTISKAVATVTVNGYTGVYDGAAHGASGTATGVGGADLSASLNLGASFTDVPGGVANWSFTGGPNYTDQSGTVNLVISQKDVTGSFTVSGKIYDGATSATVATRSVVGAVSGDDVSLSGGTATFDNANAGTGKTVTLTGAVLAGNKLDNYNLTSVGTTTADITRATAMLSLSNLTYAYDGTAKTVTVTTSPAGLAGVSVVGDNQTNAGSYPVTASLTNPNYSATDATGTLTISKAVATVTVNGYTGVYDGAAHGASGTATGVGGADLSASLNLGASFTDVPGGVANWNFSGGPNYTDQSGTAVIVISKKDVTGSFTVTNKIYDGTTPALGATYIVNGKVGSDDVSLSGGTAAFDTKDAGTNKTVTLTGAALTGTAAGNYNLTSVGTTTADISQKLATITITATDKVFDGNTSANVTASVAGIVGGDDVTISASGASFDDKNVGTSKTVTANVSLGGGDAGNYSANGTATTTAGITKKLASVTPTVASKTYGDADPTLTGTLAGFLDDDNVIAGYSRTAGETVAGSPYTISAALSPTGALGNYAITYNTATLTITKKAVTVTADAKSKTYGDADPALTYSVSPALVSGDAFAGALTRDAGTNVGSYAIGQGTLALSDNYTLNYTGANLTITQKAITITADARTKIYGSADPNLTASVVGVVGADAPTGSLSRAVGENVGTYAINKDTYTFGGNYAETYVGANLSITQKAITITAEAKSKVYGSADPALTTTAAGVVGTDAPTGSLSRATGETVGTYAITQGSYTYGGNYSETFVGANLTITKKAASVTPNTVSKTYGSPDPTLTGTLTGFLADDNVTAGYSRTAGETVAGSPYTISAALSPAGVLGNYTVTYNTAAFTITKAALTVKADDKSVQYSDVLTFTSAITGFVTGETASVLGGTLTYATTATLAGNGAVLSGAGAYAITPGGLTSSNYAISFANGALTVTKENSELNYSGAEYFSTGSASSTQAIIALSATLMDKNDGSRGDVRNAKVDFTGNGFPNGTANVGLINSSDLTVGSATLSNLGVTLNNNEFTSGGKTIEVILRASGNYYTSGDALQTVTISVPGADFVTGGGNIVLTSSTSGDYAGTVGSKMNFGFTMKYNKSGRNLQGQITTLFRRYETIDGVEGWYTYKIKSNAINSLAVVTEGGFRKGVVSTKANLDRTSPLGVVASLGGNYDLTLEAWEVTAGNGHKIAVILRKSTGGTLFCSNWTGTTYATSFINGGNVKVLNSAGARVAAPEAAEQPLQLSVQASPNPTTGLLTVRVSGAGEQPTVKLRLYNLMQRVAGEWTLNVTNGSGEKTIDIRSVDGGVFLLSAEGNRSRAVQRIIRAD